MLSASEARNTSFSITAHVRTLCCDFCGITTDFESILEEILLGREQGNLELKPKQKEELQAIVFERSRLFNCRSNCRITETSA